MDHITKQEIKHLAGVTSDAALSRWWQETLNTKISEQAVRKWGGNTDPIPESRQWQIRALIAEGKISGRERV